MFEDVDTYGQIVVDRDKFRGRRKIIINASYDEFISNPKAVIAENLETIESEHNKNVNEMIYLYRYYCGIQEILNKMAKDGSTINNISCTNYAHEIVEFKKGFIVGKPIKYVNTETETSEDMKYLLKYINKVKKKSKDLNKYENLFITGLAYTFTIPSKKAYDSEKDSPFEHSVISNLKTSMIYSSDVDNKRLFSLYRSKTKNEDGVEEITYTAYYDYTCLIFKKKDNKELDIIKEQEISIEQPITEYERSQSRMGVFEPVLSALDSCNLIRSNQLDNIEQFVNAYLIFLNQDPKFFTQQVVNDLKKNRVIALKTNNPQAPADVKLLQNTLEHSDINSFYNNQKQDLFNIVGVPMATSNTGQGVSGEAQNFGGGWETAQARASVETTYISQFEQEDLEKFIYICNDGVNPKTKKLDVDEIEIKYTINKSNNLLTKMQSFKYWIDMGGTWERGLELCDLTEDSYVVGKESEEHLRQVEERELELEVRKETEIETLKSKLQPQTTNEQDITEE